MKTRLTLPRIQSLVCPPDKHQVFLYDADTPRLAVRVTAGGTKTFVFEGRFGGKNLRMTIGNTTAWTIDQAREEARRIQRLIDVGDDPREAKAKRKDTALLERQQRKQAAVTVGEAWTAFIAAHSGPHGWRPGTRALVLRMANTGEDGRAPGPLAAVMDLPLAELDGDTVRAIFTRENPIRPKVTVIAVNWLNAFTRWCSRQKPYRPLVRQEVIDLSGIKRDLSVSSVPRKDCLLREHLPAFFAACQAEDNPCVAAALQGLLLTGARKTELLTLRWEDVDFQWRSLRIADKVADHRMIPLTPYLAGLIASLPRRNAYVFSSARSGDGRLTSNLNWNLDRVIDRADIPHVTLHGLRRSFASLAEWVEVPAGIVAQIMGHAPSATAEKHYRVRPLDLLREWHERIEAWILEQAGIAMNTDSAAALPAIRRVK